jgi:PDDEXK-like domain of unknown function (DUF3799)
MDDETGRAAATATTMGAASQSCAVDDLPDGIYFGLEESRYHGLRRVGSSGLKHLLTSGPTFWWHSWMNEILPPEREDKDSLTSGSALHKIVLEGEEEFAAAYAVMPDKTEIGALDTISDMQRWMSDQGIAFKKSASKSETIATLVAGAATMGLKAPPIWERIESELKASGRELMKNDMYMRSRLSSSMIVNNRSLVKCFQDGYPEVSILWTEEVEWKDPATGAVHVVEIRCKARLDYLKLRATVDLKTMANQGSKPFDVAVLNAIAAYRYDTQFAHYAIAREQARRLVSEGKVFDLTAGRKLRRKVMKDGSWTVVEENLMPPKWWLDDFAKRTHISRAKDAASEKDHWTWIWVVVQKTGAPESKGYEYRPGGAVENVDGRRVGSVSSMDAAFASRSRALDVYARHWCLYGENMWIRNDDIEVLTADHLPQYIRDEASV